MADVSGVSGSSRPDVSAFASARAAQGSGDDANSLKKLREELLAEARVAAREVAADAEKNPDIRSGVTAPAPAPAGSPSSTTLLRSTAPTADRPRGFQPEDTQDRIELSQEARSILAKNQGVVVEEEADREDSVEVSKNSSFLQRVDKQEENEAKADNDIRETVLASDSQEELEDDSATESNNVFQVVARNDNADDDENISSDADDQIVQASQASIDENAAANAVIGAAPDVVSAANDVNIARETNQITINEDDTTEVTGNLDDTSRPQGERVLGQIIDQFA